MVRSDADPFLAALTLVRSNLSEALTALAKVQGVVSSRVPNALDGSRGTVVDYAFALTEEVHELARELNWRPWRVEQPIDYDKVVEEYADVLAFLGVLTVNAAKMLGVSSARLATDVAEAYLRVSIRNYNRFEEGLDGGQ